MEASTTNVVKVSISRDNNELLEAQAEPRAWWRFLASIVKIKREV